MIVIVMRVAVTYTDRALYLRVWRRLFHLYDDRGGEPQSPKAKRAASACAKSAIARMREGYGRP